MRAIPVSVFVTPHGFGHAARCCAVMEEAFALEPRVEFHVFTTVPEWFFRDSLTGPFHYHESPVDPGLSQPSALRMDLAGTSTAMKEFLSAVGWKAEAMAQVIHDLGCAAVLSDISPLGILAGKAARVPTLLLESFTWDQVLRRLDDEEGELVSLSNGLAEIYGRADVRLRAEPFVPDAEEPDGGGPDAARSDAGGTDARGPEGLIPGVEKETETRIVELPPVARRPRTAPETTRQALGVSPDRPLVLLTMGGMGGDLPFLGSLSDRPDVYFVAPGAGDWVFESNALLLPPRSGYFHPDLVAAADAVVGKLGYSTLAEVTQSGTAYGFVARPDFAETPTLSAWILERKQGLSLEGKEFRSGAWLSRLDDLLALKKAPPPPAVTGGGRRAAEVLLDAARPG